MKITSRSNPRILQLRNLLNSKFRNQQKLMLIEGEKLIFEAIMSSINIECAVFTSEFAGSRLLETLSRTELIEVDEQVLLSLCDTKTPQGIIACVPLPPCDPLQDYVGNWIALCGVQNPGNVGAIIRTADAFGCAGVVLNAECADVFSPKVVRSSMGSIFHIRLVKSDISDEIQKFRNQGYSIIASHLNGSGIIPQNLKKLLLIGNESKGLSQDLVAQSDVLYKIEMKGKAESLNAAAAAAIMIYEMQKAP